MTRRHVHMHAHSAHLIHKAVGTLERPATMCARGEPYLPTVLPLLPAHSKSSREYASLGQHQPSRLTTCSRRDLASKHLPGVCDERRVECAARCGMRQAAHPYTPTHTHTHTHTHTPAGWRMRRATRHPRPPPNLSSSPAREHAREQASTPWLARHQAPFEACGMGTRYRGKTRAARHLTSSAALPFESLLAR